MRSIYLIRHGEPELGNKKPVCIGQINLPLSDKGIEQARQLKEFFCDKEIDSVFSSSLLRCTQTAEIISDNIIINKDFREVNVGDWDGMSFEEIKLKYPKEYEARGRDLENYAPNHGESFNTCLQRSRVALQKSIESSEGNIVIAAHAGVNRVLLCWMMNKPLSSMFQLPQPYGCFNIIHYEHSVFNVVEVGKNQA